MTCHIALAFGDAAVLLCDGQGSTADSEMHGLQKQFAGTEFIFGGAGSVLLINELLEHLNDTSATLSGLAAKGAIEDFVNSNFATSARGDLHGILVTREGGECWVRTYFPGHLNHMARRQPFASIGSGSAFVTNAVRRYEQTGRRLVASGHPVDLLVAVIGLSAVANESLTVDDHCLVSLLIGERSYLMGSADIRPRIFHKEIIDSWPELSSFYAKIDGFAKAIGNEYRNAVASVGGILGGSFDAKSFLPTLAGAAQGVAQHRQQLRNNLDAYCQRYDQLLGRSQVHVPPLP